MNHSRLLQRLDTRIAAAKTQLEADCLQCEKAVYFARLRVGDESETLIRELHRRYDAAPNVMISAWLNLAEGLEIYFGDMGPGARDKVRRSHALSTAADLGPLRALSSAWLAQLEYMRHDVDATARHLKEALQLAEPQHHAARSRACLVAAQALHHAGRCDLALEWNSRARKHAVDEGDAATISALMHNMGWLRMLSWRQSVLTGEVESLGEHALMGAESTGNFDRMVGASTLSVLNPLLRAQILSLQGLAAEALTLYLEHLVPEAEATVSRLQGNLLADRAWCHATLGDAASAREYAVLAETSLNSETHIDDRAATHSRLAQVYAAIGEQDTATCQDHLAVQAWEANRQLQSRVVGLLGELSTTDA